MMHRRHFALVMVGGMLTAGALATRPGHAEGKKHILCVTHAAGFRHSSRDLAAETVVWLGYVTGKWDVVGKAEDAAQLKSWMTPEKLKGVDLVFFANTTGDLGLSTEEKATFYNWIKAGGNYAGVHSAGDTYHGDADYLNLVRGEFLTHGAQVKVNVINQDPTHPATKDLPECFAILDEIYEFKNWDRKNVHVLLSMHKHPQKPELGDYPVAWTNRVGEGRMFYTSLGHREDVYGNALYQKHLAGGIEWALGLAKGDDTPGNPIK